MIRNEDLFTRLEKFKEVIESPSNFDRDQAQNSLHELKIILIRREYLSNNANKINFAERMMFREVLELAIIMCIRMENFNDIQNYFYQLSFYYFENNDLPQSQRMFTLIDVSLLSSLALENNEEYLINLAQIRTAFPNFNFIIQFVLDVELCLNSNSISKLTHLMENSPSYLFDIFLKKILFIIRKSLAKSVIKQSNGMNASQLFTLLQFKDESELDDFLESIEWETTNEGEIIVNTEEVKEETKNKHAKLENILSYAFKFNSFS